MTQGDKDILEKAEVSIINIVERIGRLKHQGMGASADTQQIERKVCIYLVLEGFHAISIIVGLFNDCEESEAEIFEFAEYLYKRYVK